MRWLDEVTDFWWWWSGDEVVGAPREKRDRCEPSTPSFLGASVLPASPSPSLFLADFFSYAITHASSPFPADKTQALHIVARASDIGEGDPVAGRMQGTRTRRTHPPPSAAIFSERG